MGYYVHNKYDKASIDGLSTTGSAQTLVDYYADYEKYKNLDTSKGFGKVYDTLEYITPKEQTGTGTGTGTGSHFNFASSIIIRSIQIGKATVNVGTLDIPIGTINPSKTFVFLTGFNVNQTGDRDRQAYGASPVIVDALAKNTLTLKAFAPVTRVNEISYQIIEFK